MSERPSLPWWQLLLLVAVELGYIALPIDLIPDPIPVLGFGDDVGLGLVLLWLAYRRRNQGLPNETDGVRLLPSSRSKE